MGDFTDTKKISFSKFSRDLLGHMVANNFIDSIQVENLDAGEENDDENFLATPTNQQIRYLEEKKMFLLLMFGPDLPSVYEVKNSPHDYMMGLLLYISSNVNFSYNFGLFKDRMKSFEILIRKWNQFLDKVVNDISSIEEFSIDNLIILEIEDMIEFYIRENCIVDLKFNMDKFDRIFREMGKSYQFRIYLTEGGEQQLFTTGSSNGDGKNSGLCNELSNFKNLIKAIKERGTNN